MPNLATTLSDKKIPIDNNGMIDHYVADITSVSDSAICVIEFDFSKPLDIFDNNGNLIGNQSPALALWSEVYHAYIDLINLDLKDKIYNKDKNGGFSERDALYQIEEPYVHEIIESLEIDALEEINPDINVTKRESYENVWPSKGTVDVPTKVK
jgi:hypothetical protein